MKKVITYKDLPTLQHIKINDSYNGKDILDFETTPNQFNIELVFDYKQYGVGLTQNMTDTEVGVLIVELGLSIMKG